MTHPIDSFVTLTRPGDYLLVVDNGVNMPDEWLLRVSKQWRIETAVDGTEAFSHAKSDPPTLLLVEISLLQVGMDPFGLLRQIRQDAVLKTLPVILLTDRANEDQAFEGLMAGADDYFVKPFSAREFIRRLEMRLELMRLQQKNRQDFNGTKVDENEATNGISQKMTQRIHQSEARYQALFKAIDTGFCVVEVLFDADDRPVDYRFLEANPAFEAHTGLVNAVGKSARELIPQLEQHWFETYGRVARSGQSERFINEAKPMDGRWFEVYAFPLGNDQVGLLFTDISERKRAEETLRESEARQSFLLMLRDHLSHLTAATDITAAAAELLGHHLHVSSVIYAEIDETAEYAIIWSDWTDGTVPSIVGRYRLDDFGVGDLYRAGRIRRTDDIRADLEHETIANYEPLKFRASIGVPLLKGPRLVAVMAVHSAAPRRWADAEVALVQDVGERIAAEIERARAEVALRESEERQRIALEIAELGTWDLELDTYVCHISPRLAEIFGLPPVPTTVSHEEWSNFVIAEDRAPLEATLATAIEQETRFEMELRIVRRDGTLRWLESSGTRQPDTSQTPRFLGVMMDITERKKAEMVLRQSEERFRKALEIETVGVIFFNVDGSITSANDAFLHMGGYTREDVQAGRLQWDQLTPPEFMPASLHAVEEFKAFGHTTPYEKQYYRKDGSRWWALFAAKRLSPDEGIEFVLDITTRKEIELTLQDTEERLRLILDSAKDYAIYALDTEGQLISWNTGAERIFGYTEAEVLGQHERLIYNPTDRADGIPGREMQQALDVGYSEDERWHLHKEGRLFYGSGMVRPLRDHNGSLRGFTKVMRDETLRKQAEQRMQMLQQLAADLSARLTAQDMGKSILQACRNVVDGTGASLYVLLTEQQVLERVFTDGVPRTVQTPYQQLSLNIATPLTDAIHQRQIVWGSTQETYIQRYPHLRDAIFSHNIHAYIALPLILEQRILGAIAISFSQPKHLSREEHDFLIAVAHLCAQALERAQFYEIEKETREAAEKANQIKMQFLGMISHELRTPLASIKGFTTTLLASDVKFTPEKQYQFLEVIDQEADKLTDLVVQLLDLTRLQAGSLRIVVSPRALEEIIAVAQTQLQTLTRQHQLLIALPHDLPSVLADPQRVAQVLVNLVGNAAKFSPQGSTITIRAFQEQGVVRVDVSDEGLGIPPENHTEVFEAFRQVERLTTNHDPGAGLGLAICKGIIETHGGRIWIQDREGGTTVSFTLPVVTREEGV